MQIPISITYDRKTGEVKHRELEEISHEDFVDIIYQILLRDNPVDLIEGLVQ